jgi:hypothetical protein
MKLEEQLRNCRPALEQARNRVAGPSRPSSRSRSRVLVGAVAILGCAAVVSIAFGISRLEHGSNSFSVTAAGSATTVQKERFEIARVARRSGLPCSPGEYRDRTALARRSCLTVAAPIVRNADIVRAKVAYDPIRPAWQVSATLTTAATKRFDGLSATRFGAEIAVLLSDRVVATFALNYGSSRGVVLIDNASTRAQAIALATRITGRAPQHVESADGAAHQLVTRVAEICRQYLPRTPGAKTLSGQQAETAGQVANAFVHLGLDPRPWNAVPATQLVASCSYQRSQPRGSTTPTKPIEIYADAAGHHSVNPAPSSIFTPSG